ncbi:MAG: divalent-cation tolerance protein CutA [Rhodospirillales bacterium]|nr:divalent-cation tolerance protein CutA [Rhodospirillales bacterium]
MEFRTLYVTVGNIEEARRIGRALVEARLVACANLIPGVESVYWWQGEIAEDREVVLIAKTRADRVDVAIAKVKSMHSYAVPCVVALPILAGNRDYFDWIAQATAKTAKS